ncbi:SRPBCC family protein [Streptomyces sp. M600PL45_2]|uniref:SRPBCC family protein n=1 Tax=Streptomyces marispadix TaxID=2922868 RepID=A0ABS9SRG7_9ACTN|nr:SRPBCC family protein [Streptomyces marispadix]
MRPVVVHVDVDRPREEVYDFLDVLAAHEEFTDHMLREWECSGPSRGVGAKAQVTAVVAGRREGVAIEVVEAKRPLKIVERNTGAGGRRVAHGTYLLQELAGSGTRVFFEYAWRTAPASERLAAPVTRWLLRRANTRALRRLAGLLESHG